MPPAYSLASGYELSEAAHIAGWKKVIGHEGIYSTTETEAIAAELLAVQLSAFNSNMPHGVEWHPEEAEIVGLTEDALPDEFAQVMQRASDAAGQLLLTIAQRVIATHRLTLDLRPDTGEIVAVMHPTPTNPDQEVHTRPGTIALRGRIITNGAPFPFRLELTAGQLLALGQQAGLLAARAAQLVLAERPPAVDLACGCCVMDIDQYGHVADCKGLYEVERERHTGSGGTGPV